MKPFIKADREAGWQVLRTSSEHVLMLLPSLLSFPHRDSVWGTLGLRGTLREVGWGAHV